MELKCTKCGDNIDSRLANVQTDLIQCPSCNTIHKLSQLFDNQKDTSSQYKPAYKRNYDHREIASLSDNLPEKPTGSKLEVYSTYSTIEIIAPPAGLSGGSVFLGGFSAFWLTFVAFWTFFAAQGSIFFALFSIPFWLVGFGMASGVIRRLVERQYIEIDSRSITIRKKGLLFSKEEEVPIHSIDSIGRRQIKLKNAFSAIGNAQSTSYNTNNSSKTPMTPTIQMGVKEVSFLENALEIEQDWAIKLLNKAIENQR